MARAPRKEVIDETAVGIFYRVTAPSAAGGERFCAGRMRSRAGTSSIARRGSASGWSFSPGCFRDWVFDFRVGAFRFAEPTVADHSTFKMLTADALSEAEDKSLGLPIRPRYCTRPPVGSKRFSWTCCTAADWLALRPRIRPRLAFVAGRNQSRQTRPPGLAGAVAQMSARSAMKGWLVTRHPNSWL